MAWSGVKTFRVRYTKHYPVAVGLLSSVAEVLIKNCIPTFRAPRTPSAWPPPVLAQSGTKTNIAFKELLNVPLLSSSWTVIMGPSEIKTFSTTSNRKWRIVMTLPILSHTYSFLFFSFFVSLGPAVSPSIFWAVLSISLSLPLFMMLLLYLYLFKRRG